MLLNWKTKSAEFEQKIAYFKVGVVKHKKYKKEYFQL